MASAILVPQVARVHWDDIVQQFYVVISFELQGPLGNYRREVRVNVGNLLAALAQIAATWGSPSGSVQFDNLGYPYGDLTKFIEDFNSFDPPATLIPELPTPLPVDPGGDDFGTYDGETDHWGRTVPP